MRAHAAAQAAPVYITVGDDAWRLIASEVNDARLLGSRDVEVSVPVRRGEAALTRAHERVHVLEVDERWLPRLSQAVHEELHRCGEQE